MVQQRRYRLALAEAERRRAVEFDVLVFEGSEESAPLTPAHSQREREYGSPHTLGEGAGHYGVH